MPVATRVAIAVVESAGHVLTGVRPEGVPLSGKAEFPGGKCETDETTRSCVVRECREETGLLVIPREHLVSTTHEYEHGVVELDFWRCVLSPDLPDLAAPAEPFRWVKISELRYMNFPEGNRQVLSMLTGDDRRASEPDPELAEMLTRVSDVFADVSRPDHFTDYTHCDDCLQHDQTLQKVTVDSIGLKHLGNPAWDPIAVCTDDAFRYLLPGLLRTAVVNPAQYFERFLLQLTAERFAALSPQEQSAVREFLRAYRERMQRQVKSQTGEWSFLPSHVSEDSSPMTYVDRKLGELVATGSSESKG